VAALNVYEESVQPEWIDYNGHMSEAFYVLVFGHASDALYEQVGIGTVYRERHRLSVYTVEAHIRYLREVSLRSRLRVATSVVDHDDKRIHFCHEMRVADTLVATEELIGVCVDTGARCVAAIPDDVLANLAQIVLAEPPAYVGRSVHLDRRAASR